MYPSYESYQRRTDREIPVVVLHPASSYTYTVETPASRGI
jgi:hypothetical protein